MDDLLALFREGLLSPLAERGFDVVSHAADLSGLLAEVDAHEPDLAVIDIRMPPPNTVEGVRAAESIFRSHRT